MEKNSLKIGKGKLVEKARRITKRRTKRPSRFKILSTFPNIIQLTKRKSKKISRKEGWRRRKRMQRRKRNFGKTYQEHRKKIW